MPRYFVGVVVALVAANPVLAQLSQQEILAQLPGQWAYDPSETPSDEIGEYRCDAHPLNIRISEESGDYIYESQHTGVEDVARSRVRFGQTPAVGAPAILLKYEDEARRDDAGELVEWFLVMPDVDRFYWVRRDWGDGARTAMRRRCAGEVIS